MSHCKNVTSDGITILAKKCPKLRYFVSKYVTVINDMAFKELALKCPNLEHVCLQSCHVS